MPTGAADAAFDGLHADNTTGQSKQAGAAVCEIQSMAVDDADARAMEYRAGKCCSNFALRSPIKIDLYWLDERVDLEAWH